MTTMADLTDGTRIFHRRWKTDGTIRVIGDDVFGPTTEIRWDDCSVHCQVSDLGPVFPDDLEITGRPS